MAFVRGAGGGGGAPRHGVALFGGIVNEKEPKLFGPTWLRP